MIPLPWGDLPVWVVIALSTLFALLANLPKIIGSINTAIDRGNRQAAGMRKALGEMVDEKLEDHEVILQLTTNYRSVKHDLELIVWFLDEKASEETREAWSAYKQHLLTINRVAHAGPE